MSQRTVRLLIAGRVQGVGFRAFVEVEARRRALEGWVRNRRDGTVEAVVAGSGEAVAEMIDVCRRGAPAARVSAVDAAEADAGLLGQRRPGELFSILPTA